MTSYSTSDAPGPGYPLGIDLMPRPDPTPPPAPPAAELLAAILAELRALNERLDRFEHLAARRLPFRFGGP